MKKTLKSGVPTLAIILTYPQANFVEFSFFFSKKRFFLWITFWPIKSMVLEVLTFDSKDAILEVGGNKEGV